MAPLVPLGTHSGIGTVDQNKVVTTIRGTEVAADPTNALALEAAVRRQEALSKDPRSSEFVRLASSQRVVRSQVFEGDLSFSHFRLFGLVAAGRDTGAHRFEQEAITEHIQFFREAMKRAGSDHVRVEVSDFDGSHGDVIAKLVSAVKGTDIDVLEQPDREDGRGYYVGIPYGGYATWGSRTLEIADGGMVDWTQKLLSNPSKERLLISGFGVERVASSLKRLES